LTEGPGSERLQLFCLQLDAGKDGLTRQLG
jgi:hypothetical protein